MPSIDFVIPESFLFIPANLSYISFSFFISFILFRVFKSGIVFLVSFLLFTGVMYYDLAFKFLVKNYYDLFEKDSIVYSYPVKVDNKIESLSTIRVYKNPNTFNSLNSAKQTYLESLHENHIDKFIDIYTYQYKFNKYKMNKERIFLNIYKYNNLFLDDRSKEARFKIVVDLNKNQWFPSLYKSYIYKFIDTHNDKVLTSAYYIKFVSNDNKLRNKLLFWTKEKEDYFKLEAIDNFDFMYKKLFLDYRED